MGTNRIVAAAVVAATLLAVVPVWAQPESYRDWRGDLTITVTGEARGRPDVMQIELVSEAVAASASDAFRQCKEKGDSAAKAIGELKIPESQVAREMYEFSPPAPSDPLSPLGFSRAPKGTRVLQVLKVKVKITEKSARDNLAATISRVFDAAHKCGVSFREASGPRSEIFGEGGPPPVTYLLQDATPLAKRAVADAFQKAKEARDTLTASGVRPGTLVSVDYQRFTEMQEAMPWRRSAIGRDTLDAKSAVSTSPDEVIVRRSLTFTYQIRPSDNR